MIPIKSPSMLGQRNLFSSLEDNSVTPLVISKSLLESDLALEEATITNRENLPSISSNLTSSNIDIAILTSTNNLRPEPPVEPENLFSSLEDNSITPLVIAKTSVEPNLALEKTPSVSQKSEKLSSINSNIDITAFDNVSNLSQPNDLGSVFSIEPIPESLESLESLAKPYEFDFNINNSIIDIDEVLEVPLVTPSIEQTSQSIEEVVSSEINQEPNIEANQAQEPMLLSSFTSLPIEETPETIPNFSLSSISLEQADLNSLTSAQEDLSNQSQVTQITEQGQFEFDLGLPKPPVKTTVDIEKALASFEAEKDRLANAPTLSELPIIEDIPDPDPDILDLDISSEALKETQKIPIIKRPTEYLQTSYDNQFDPISPNHPTVKVPVVPYLEDEQEIGQENRQDAIESSKEQPKKFATISEINKITTKLPAVVIPLPEGLEVKTAANIEPQKPQEPVKPPLTEREIDTDDIYLDPFTGVFEAVIFPDEESKIPASLLVNKFATKTSLPEVISEIALETTQPQSDAENNINTENNIIERQTKELVSDALNIGKAANSPEYTDEGMSLNDMASAVTESEIIIPEVINQLPSIAATTDLRELTYIQSEEFQEPQGFQQLQKPQDLQSFQDFQDLQDSQQSEAFQQFTNIEDEKLVDTDLPSTEVPITSLPVAFSPNKLIDVSLDLNELNDLVINDLVIDEHITQDIINNQTLDPIINKSTLGFASEPNIATSSTMDLSVPNKPLFASQNPFPPPSTRLTGENQILPPPDGFSPLTQPPLRISGQHPVSPFSTPALANIEDKSDTDFLFNPVEKTLGDLLLGTTSPIDAVDIPVNFEASPIEYVPDEFVFGERNFNTPALARPAIMETLPSTTLSADSLPNEIVLGIQSESDLPIPTLYAPKANEISLPTVSSILNSELANKWPSPETESESESDFGFDTIMDEMEVDGSNTPDRQSKITPSLVKQFFPIPALPPPLAIPSIKPFTITQHSTTQSPNKEMFSSPVAAKVSLPSPSISNVNLPKNQLVMSRKFNNDIIAGRELAILYEKFVEVCSSYKAPDNMPSEDQFRVKVLSISKGLKSEWLSSEILCSLEIVEGNVHVYCQATRVSLFQKRSERQRVF